jgi:hypothetical protein
MGTSLYDDSDFRARVNGGKEWNGQVGGHRGMTREILTQRITGLLPDFSDYIYADDLTADELNALRERSALFDPGFMGRGTGYNVMRSQEQEVPTVGSNTNKVRIFFDSSASSGNGPPSGNTYNYRNAHVSDIGHIATLSVEWVEAVAYPTEVGGTSSPLIGHSGFTPYLTSLGEDVVMTNFTYKGGQAPRE